MTDVSKKLVYKNRRKILKKIRRNSNGFRFLLSFYTNADWKPKMMSIDMVIIYGPTSAGQWINVHLYVLSLIKCIIS